MLLVSAGVLAMLFARAEGRAFQLPGGDGAIVMIAGGWAALLIFYRLLDKPGLQGNERVTATVGVEWGIFIALLLALGARLRRRADARRRTARAAAEAPPAPRARARPSTADAAELTPGPSRHRRAAPLPAREPAAPRARARRGSRRSRAAEQLSFEEPARRRSRGAERPAPGSTHRALKAPRAPLEQPRPRRVQAAGVGRRLSLR